MVWVTEVPDVAAGEICSVSVPKTLFPAAAPVTPLTVQVQALLLNAVVVVYANGVVAVVPTQPEMTVPAGVAG